jgi:hypothetical protein
VSDEHDPYYRDAEERREAINQILDCTRDWPSPREHIVFRGLLAEVARLRAENAALEAEVEQRNAERDEARREACHFQAKYQDRCACPPYMSISKYVTQDAMRLAKDRGWDCFKEVQP